MFFSYFIKIFDIINFWVYKKIIITSHHIKTLKDYKNNLISIKTYKQINNLNELTPSHEQQQHRKN